MDSLLQSSPSVGPSMTNGSQNMAMVPLVQEHSLAAVSHQESFDLGMFTADEVLFGGEFDEMYIHTIDESLFAGTVGPSFLPSTAPFYMTSPTHQIQLQQHGHPQEQPQRYQSQQHQHNHGPSYCHPDDLHQTLSRDTFMTSPGPQQPGCSNHHPTSPSHYPHFSMQLFQQNIPYIGSIHGLIEIRPVGMEMLQHRAPVVERLSSPDGSMSPNSDHGYMDSMTDDEPSSSSYSSYNSLSSLADDHIASPLSQLSVSCDPLEEMIPRSPLHPAQASQVPQLDYSHMTMDPSIASPMISPTSKRTPQSSPLKQHFSSFSDSEGPEEDESQLQGKPRKRVRRPHVKKAPQQPKLMTKLPCAFPGCTITCSSQPSLARHAETHKWRGLYAPVRCEACQSALSNEFSVQRHILRAPATSACRKMRVYSVMRSEAQVECTVRFYPKRPHGKKTVVVGLEAFRRQSER